MTGAHPRRIAAALGLCVALAACAAPTSPGAPPPQSGASPQRFVPVAIDGVQSCRELVTSAGGAGEDAPPSLRLPCLTDRGLVDVSRLGGTPTLVNLWATWCGPCRKEMPVLQAGYEQVDGAVQFVGVDTRDDPASAAGYLPEVGVTYPQLVDPDGQLLEHTRIPGLPVTLLLDEHGVEVARHVGPLTPADLTELLNEL
jgi:cytochrome c biogenesis protein CcmG/thiol:disulfide interchange protein DsbE